MKIEKKNDSIKCACGSQIDVNEAIRQSSTLKELETKAAFLDVLLYSVDKLKQQRDIGVWNETDLQELGSRVIALMNTMNSIETEANIMVNNIKAKADAFDRISDLVENTKTSLPREKQQCGKRN